MADILTIFGVLLIIALAFPALLTTVWLTLPHAVDRAQQRIAAMPKRTFGMGLFMLLLIGLPVVLLLASPSAAIKVLGWLLLLLVLATSTIGAAGMAARLAQQIQGRTNQGLGLFPGFLVGAVALELAAAFPLIGWLTVLPLALIMALGATALALLRPRPQPTAAEPRPALHTDWAHG